MEVQDPKAGEAPLAELTGIQFGVLSREETVTFSVFERNHSISKVKDLWDSRLGIYNLPGNGNHCTTCGAKKAGECDGHFGHVNLPMPIYHPLHIRFLKKLLSQICLVCKRFKQQSGPKKGSFEDEATWMEMKRLLEDVECQDSGSDSEIEVIKESCSLKTTCNIEALSTQNFAVKSKRTHISENPASPPLSLKFLSTDIRSKHIAAYIGSKGSALPTLIENSDDYLQSVKFSTISKCPENMVEELESCESSDDEEGCKYCGAKLKKPDERYPNLVVTLSRSKDNSYETIEMKACGKVEKLPQDYWKFVGGTPEGCINIRPLLPIEAFRILQSLSKKVIRKLGMNECVARPDALILHNLPVSPSGARIITVDFGSSLPTTQTDRQHRLLQRLSSEVKRLQSFLSVMGTPTWATSKKVVMELQILASAYLTGSKWEHGLKPIRAFDTVFKSDVGKEDRYMKGHILAKCNNASARIVVVGDPFIKLEEISLPIFLVEHLTIPEKVTALNIDRLQQYVENGPYPDLYKTGAVYLNRPGRGQVHVRVKRMMVLEVGDTVHRHIKEGDLIIVNRTPTLTKHSFMAMRVRFHVSCSLAINPLSCASFQADFDGDCMHLYVPQTPETLAEVQELLNVSNQLINPQGGQSNNALTEDSRLGAYLINSPCLFLNKTEMSQLAMSSLASSLPIPAILKFPKMNGPLWTGQQLYSTIIPKGIYYRKTDKKFSTDVKRGIFISDGEILVCNGHSDWLGNASDALTTFICSSQGPPAALAYLNHAQELANLYIRNRGFSVGLQDFQLTRNRSRLLSRRLEEVGRGNREALLKTLLMDENVQREELNKNPTSKRGLSVGTECSKSKGLYLGTTGIVNRVEALDKVAIERFQAKFGQTTNRLAKDYCKKVNPLLVMINARSKGSMTKLVQQTISLGLQLYKGEYLLPWSVQNLSYQRQLTDASSLRAIDFLQFEKRAPLVNLSGYWESRGIITSSYLDGLSPLQFFTHTIASRYGMMRSKVEEPNLLLKRLLLFLRNLHVEYDGSVRSLEGRQIVQFEYGGLLEMEGKGGAFSPVKRPTDLCEAGEPVGILAATAVTEPAYQLKLDSPHNVGAKAIGPLDLINESLSSSKAIRIIDRRVLLRMPLALRNRRHGQEKGAMRIHRHLKPITLDMVTSTTMIEYRKKQIGLNVRESPWVGHIRLNGGKLNVHQVLEGEVLTSLEKKHTTCKFSLSYKCRFGSSKASEGKQEPCIHFYLIVPSTVAELDEKAHGEHFSALLEAMKITVLPILLGTSVNGDDKIETVTVLWEDTDWSPRCLKYPSSRNSCNNRTGEVIVEVTVKKEFCKSRGKAWEITQKACLPVMQLLDWQRCTPYSIRELNHVFGLEASKGVMLQRLELAVAGMGKPVNQEHLELIADSMVTSGEVNGASITGYKDLCKAISRSAPFSTAAFANPKTNFVTAGRHGSSETIEGALPSSVWGKTPSLGTGSGFGILWQAKAGEEQEFKIQKGDDIHECIAKMSSLAPETAPDLNGAAPETFRHEMRCRDSFEYGLDDDERRVTGSDLKMGKIGDGRAEQLSRHVEGDVPSAPNKAPSQPTKVGTEGILGAGPSLKSERAEVKRKRRFSSKWAQKEAKFVNDSRPLSTSLEARQHPLQACRGRDNGTKVQGGGQRDIVVSPDVGSNIKLEQIQELKDHMRALTDDFGEACNLDDGSKRQPHSAVPISHPRVTVSIPTEEDMAHEDSSSFHTPNEKFETPSANSSPCSSIRKDLHPPPFPDNASDDDQMSGISQPCLINKVVVAAPQLGRRFEPLELEGGVGCESMPLFEERLSRKVSMQHSNYTIEPAISGASEDALERQKQGLTDKWEHLMKLSRRVQNILHNKYRAGERLRGMDQRLIIDDVLRFHPDNVQKVGCGVHYIKVDLHPEHSKSRCFFVVRTDKSICDFSYRQCIKGVANEVSPALAMRYDHEVLLKHERENCSDIDVLDSPDLYPLDSDVPSWPPRHNGEQVGFGLNLPEMKQANEGGCDKGGCDGSNMTGLKHKEESSCETSELKPGV